MLLYFFWVMGGVVHCGHLLILLCVGPRLHMETGRFLHRRILQVNFCPWQPTVAVVSACHHRLMFRAWLMRSIMRGC